MSVSLLHNAFYRFIDMETVGPGYSTGMCGSNLKPYLLLIPLLFAFRSTAKLEDASDLYSKAANNFKMAKNWAGMFNRCH